MAELKSGRSDPRIIVVETGYPPAAFAACALCGVLIWDIDGHFQYTHPDEVNISG